MIKGKIVFGLILCILLAATQPLSVYATKADYFDDGFYLKDGAYVDRTGARIKNVKKRGMDVSSYQETIDWKQVAEDDISFAFVRCGNGMTGPDLNLDANAKGCRENGIDLGLYYRSYAFTEEIAQMEADYVVACAKMYDVTYPLVIDIEGQEMASLGILRQQENIKIFCDTIEAAGYTPMVYCSKNFFENYIIHTYCDRWIAEYGDQITYRGSHLRFWQCTSHGKVKGITGRVDIDFEF